MVKVGLPLFSMEAHGWLGNYSYKVRGFVWNPYPLGLGGHIRYPYKMQKFGLRPYPAFISHYYSASGWCYARRRTWHGIIWIAMHPPRSVNKKSPYQIQQQTRFKDAVSLWHTMSAATKDIYNKWTYPKKAEGFNRFIRWYIKRTPLPAIPGPSAIAFDSASNGPRANTTPTVTWNHTIGADANFLIVGMTFSGNYEQGHCTRVTFNGVDMVNVKQVQDTGYGEASIWVLKAPTTGTHAIVGYASDSETFVTGMAASYKNVKQVNAADATGGTSGTTSGHKTFNIVTVADKCWSFAVMQYYCSGFDATISSDEIKRGDEPNHLGLASQIEDSNSAITPPGTKTMGFTLGGTGSYKYWCTAGISFAPLT